MSSSEQLLPPFGWYPDPSGLPMLRWWTGTAWTDQLEAARPEIQPAAGYTTFDISRRGEYAS